MKIIHFGDIHFWELGFPLYDPFFFKRYLGIVNLMLNRRKRFPRDLGKMVLQDILQQEADLVVFSGDMTTASLKSEFSLAAECFKPLHEKWEERFFVIPGNHDRYTAKATTQDWYAKAFPYGVIDGVKALELDKSTVVVGFDASEPFLLRSNGYFSSRLGQKLDDVLSSYQGWSIILVGHYPVEYPEGMKVDKHHELINREDLKKIIETHNPMLYLHGHKHVRWYLGNAVNCGSAGMLSEETGKQAGYAIVNVESGKIKQVEAVHFDLQNRRHSKAL